MTRLAWLTGDESSGTFLDVSGNGNNVAATGLLTRTAAGGGQTYGGAQPNSKGITQSSNGTSAGPALALVQTGAYTMCAWVKRSSNSPDGWILQGETGASGDRGILFVGSNLQSRCKNGSGTVFTVQTAQPTAGTWYHIATVCTGTVLRLFINGVQVGSDVTVTSGVRTTSTGSHLFDTLGTETILDDPQYHDTALNAAQLTAIMNTPFSGGTTITVGVATETDVAQALGRRKTRLILPATDTSTAPSIGRRKLYVVGTAVETDSGQIIARRKIRTIIPAAETDTAVPAAARKLRIVGPAAETDTAPGAARRKQRVAAAAVETDTVPAVAAAKRRATAPAAETDVAVPVLVKAANTVGSAVETDTAVLVGRRRTRAVAPASEVDTAPTAGRRRAVTTASETDTAVGLFTVTRRLIGPATEQDTASPVLIPAEHAESVLTATNAPTGVLAVSHTPLSRLEASHGV